MTIAPNTMTMGPGRLAFGEDGTLVHVARQVRSCRVVPSVTQEDPEPVLSGGEAPGVRTETWTLEATVKQDLGAAESFTEWCFRNRGRLVPFLFVPSDAAGKQITGKVTVEAMAIGGEIREKPTSDIEWTLTGEPLLGDVVTQELGEPVVT